MDHLSILYRRKAGLITTERDQLVKLAEAAHQDSLRVRARLGNRPSRFSDQFSRPDYRRRQICKGNGTQKDSQVVADGPSSSARERLPTKCASATPAFKPAKNSNKLIGVRTFSNPRIEVAHDSINMLKASGAIPRRFLFLFMWPSVWFYGVLP